MEFSVGLTAVGRNGFNGCTALLDLGTDSYVTSRQFYSTPVLKLVDLRGCTSLEVIGSETFSTTRNTCTFLLDGCTALKAIYSSAFAGHGAAVELDLSGLSALELIDSNAFTRGKYIGTLVIPENVVTIGSYAFGNSAGCGSYNQFSKIDLSQSGSLETIGSYAFAYIPLQTVDFSGCTSLTAIGANAFRNDLALTELDLSACTSLASIGDNAFRDCVAVKTITIPAGVTSLASTAFTNCGVVNVLKWDAAAYPTALDAATFTAGNGFANGYDLIIGGSVDALPDQFFKAAASCGDTAPIISAPAKPSCSAIPCRWIPTMTPRTTRPSTASPCGISIPRQRA